MAFKLNSVGVDKLICLWYNGICDTSVNTDKTPSFPPPRGIVYPTCRSRAAVVVEQHYEALYRSVFSCKRCPRLV